MRCSIDASCIAACRRRASLRDRAEIQTSQGIPYETLAPALVETVFFLLLPNLDLCLVTTSAGFIPAYAGLEQLCTLVREGEGRERILENND